VTAGGPLAGLYDLQCAKPDEGGLLPGKRRMLDHPGLRVSAGRGHCAMDAGHPEVTAFVLRPRLTALRPAGAVGVTAEYTSNEVLPSERQTRPKCRVLGGGGNAAVAATHVTPVTRRSGR
jgi:hypothetical protein